MIHHMFLKELLHSFQVPRFFSEAQISDDYSLPPVNMKTKQDSFLYTAKINKLIKDI